MGARTGGAASRPPSGRRAIAGQPSKINAVRKLLTWVAGLVGVAALLRRRHRSRAVQPAPSSPSDPAAELREKLAETRSAEPAVQSPPADAGDPAPLEDPPSLEERRARVHHRAQGAIDLMRSPAEGSSEADGSDESDGAA